jgi:hypothetical protein
VILAGELYEKHAILTIIISSTPPEQLPGDNGSSAAKYCTFLIIIVYCFPAARYYSRANKITWPEDENGIIKNDNQKRYFRCEHGSKKTVELQ